MELKGIQSIEVGYRLLEALEVSRTPMALTDLSGRAGLSPSKARNYLVSLKRVQLVQQDAATGLYALGPAALRLGLVALAQIQPLEIAYAEMKNRQGRIRATQFLSVWGNKGPVIVRWLEGEDQITVEVRTGSVLPATRSATGIAFLAHLPDPVAAPVVAAELETQPRPVREVEADIERVSRHGLARIDGGLLPGIAGLAVPITDHEGRIRAVVTGIGRRGVIDIGYNGDLARELRSIRSATEERIGAPGHIPQTAINRNANER